MRCLKNWHSHTRQERGQHPARRRRRGGRATRRGGLQRGRIGIDRQGLPHHMRHVDERPGSLRHACMLRPIFTHVLALCSNTTAPRPKVAEGRQVARLCWIKWVAACPPEPSQSWSREPPVPMHAQLVSFCTDCIIQTTYVIQVPTWCGGQGRQIPDPDLLTGNWAMACSDTAPFKELPDATSIVIV